ncbi:hypothetical protein IJ670_08210, partial [bacterium]|nr:hypothetical protein [bacterium]
MNDYELETKMRMYRAPVRPQYKRKKYIKPKKSAPKFLIFICFIVTLVCVGVLCFNKLNFDRL